MLLSISSQDLISFTIMKSTLFDEKLCNLIESKFSVTSTLRDIMHGGGANFWSGGGGTGSFVRGLLKSRSESSR